jgi:hypothetical protein
MRIVKEFLSAQNIRDLVTFAAQATFQSGRQGTGYEKVELGWGVDQAREISECLYPQFRELQVISECAFPLVGTLVGTDCWLLRYLEGSSIPPHVDEVSSGLEHYRFNALIQAPEEGGQLWVSGKPVPLEVGDAYVFRPDVEQHWVDVIKRGTRLVWSVGMVGALRREES